MKSRYNMGEDEFQEHLRQLSMLSPEEKRTKFKRLHDGSPVRYGKGVFQHGRPPQLEWQGDYPIMPDAGLTPPSTRGKRK